MSHQLSWAYLGMDVFEHATDAVHTGQSARVPCEGDLLHRQAPDLRAEVRVNQEAAGIETKPWLAGTRFELKGESLQPSGTPGAVQAPAPSSGAAEAPPAEQRSSPGQPAARVPLPAEL